MPDSPGVCPCVQHTTKKKADRITLEILLQQISLFSFFFFSEKKKKKKKKNKTPKKIQKPWQVVPYNNFSVIIFPPFGWPV
jgi:hypothetical protein